MKYIFGLCALVFVGIAGWHIGSRLSPDTIGMALGILFGIMAGIPATLMALCVHHRDRPEFDGPRQYRQQPYGYGSYHRFPQQQPPVIVVTGLPSHQPQGVEPSWDDRASKFLGRREALQLEVGQRTFEVIGQDDGEVELW